MQVRIEDKAVDWSQTRKDRPVVFTLPPRTLGLCLKGRPGQQTAAFVQRYQTIDIGRRWIFIDLLEFSWGRVWAADVERPRLTHIEIGIAAPWLAATPKLARPIAGVVASPKVLTKESSEALTTLLCRSYIFKLQAWF
jgi:hypothetical protein